MNILRIIAVLSLISSYIISNSEDQKETIYLDCYTEMDRNSYDVAIPSICKVNQSQTWHLELRHIYYYHRNNQTCTESLRIVFVSNEYVIIPYSDNENGQKSLLLDYLGFDEAKNPYCVPKNEEYYQFNYDIYMNVRKNYRWNQDDENYLAIDKSVVNILDQFNKKDLNNDALTLGFQSYLLAKSYLKKFEFHEYDDNKSEESNGFFYRLFKKFFVKDEMKKIHFLDVKHYFHEITKVNLTNDLSKNKSLYNKIIKTTKEKVNDFVNLYYGDICKLRNEKVKEFEEYDNKPEEKIRKYLGRKDIMANEVTKDKQYYVWECQKIKAKEVYTSYSIDGVCYKLLPVLVDKNILMFADEHNYLYHFSPVRSCHKSMSLGKLLEYYKETELGIYEAWINFLFGSVNAAFKNVALGWWSHFSIKYKIYVIFIVIFIILIILSCGSAYIYFLLKGTTIISVILHFLFQIGKILRWISHNLIIKLYGQFKKCCCKSKEKNQETEEIELLH